MSTGLLWLGTIIDIMKHHIQFRKEITSLFGWVILFIAGIYPTSPYYDERFFSAKLLKKSFATRDLRPVVNHYWATL